VDEFLIEKFKFDPLVADFIANPETLHLWTSAGLIALILGVAYLIRLDLDPLIFGRRQSFSSLIERFVFYPIIIGLLIWTYNGPWNWPSPVPDGFFLNKFTLGLGAILILILGRAIVHFILTEKNRWDFFDQLPFYLMVEFQFAVPLVYYYMLERNGLMPKEQLGFIFACVFIACLIINWLLGRKVHFPRSPVSKWLLIFIAYILLTVIFMPYRLGAVKNIIQWVAFAACFLVGFAYIPDKRRRDVILLTAVLAALVSTLWGFWKYFDIPLNLFGMINDYYPDGHELAGLPFYFKTPSAGRYFLLAGFFANPNYYGEYVALTLFIGLGLLLKTDSPKLRTFLSIVLAINTFEIVALYNRAGWFGVFVGAGFVLILLLWTRIPIFKRVSKIGLIAGVITLVAVLLLTSTVFNKREADSETPLAATPLERLKSMTDFEGDETFRNRQTMWRASIMMVTDEEHVPERLTFGGGFGFFEIEYLIYQTKVLETYNFGEWFHNVIPTFRAHNDHLQMLVEAGIIGTFFYAMFFISFFVMGFRFLKEEEDPARRFYALGIMGATMCLLAIACFSFPLHKIQHGGLILTAMGLLVAEIVERNQLRKQRSISEEVNSNQNKDQGTTAKRKKKKRKQKESTPLGAVTREPVESKQRFSVEFYNTVQKKIKPELAFPVIIIALLLCIWGVYTQVINFKSHYFVVKGIAELRKVEYAQTPEQRQTQAQLAANYFWRAYKLDPTNGRAEFFHGFSLIKKNLYQDVVAGTAHIEEGQELYPQSDTFYALAMGYEARYKLASEQIQMRFARIESLNTDFENETDTQALRDIQANIEELNDDIQTLEEDARMSHGMAIDSYMTAARYYPVKIEYYKELIRLLEDEGRWEEIVFWSERALIVDEWLLKKPQIRWRFYLWLGRAFKILGAAELQLGNIEEGFEYWQKAEKSLIEGVKISNAVYFTYYELAQVYEALGDYFADTGNSTRAMSFYEKARDMYIQTFNKKDNVQQGEAPFNYSYFLLGRIYEKLGNIDRAVHYYNLVLTEALYSSRTETYQKARNKIHELTGEWVGEPPPGG
jgi:O-antigen ligase/tetratricopeptide (TPR) repeat protein